MWQLTWLPCWQSDYVRGLLGVGRWEGWVSVVPLVLCACSEKAIVSGGWLCTFVVIQLAVKDR